MELRRLWGIGKRSIEQFHQLGLYTVKDLRNYPESSIKRIFGKTGQHYINLVNGIDNRSIQTEHKRKSISKEHTFETDTDDLDVIKKLMYRLCEELTEQIRI